MTAAAATTVPSGGLGDEGRALLYWETLDDKGCEVLGYLIRHRGRRIHHSELVQRLRLDPTGTKNPANVLAGTPTRMNAANAAAGRCFPCRWWKEEGGTLYGLKNETAQIFDNALKGLSAE